MCYFIHIGKKYQDNEVPTLEPPGDKPYSEIPWHITAGRTGTPRYAFTPKLELSSATRQVIPSPLVTLSLATKQCEEKILSVHSVAALSGENCFSEMKRFIVLFIGSIRMQGTAVVNKTVAVLKNVCSVNANQLSKANNTAIGLLWELN